MELALRMPWPLQALLHVLLALPLTVAFGVIGLRPDEIMVLDAAMARE